MKIAIGDIHGQDFWKKYIDEDFENLYFVGDYFDNYEKTPAVSQIRNFKEICDFARKDNRIKLCLGNHCFHYLKGIDRSEKYSGYQYYNHFDIQEALEENMDLIEIVYQDGDTLISHAGITKTFLKSLNLENPLDINQRFKEYRMALAFCGYDRYGDDITQGPLWVRPTSLLSDKVDGYKQIVGHTTQYEILTVDDVTFIDVEGKDVYKFDI